VKARNKEQQVAASDNSSISSAENNDTVTIKEAKDNFNESSLSENQNITTATNGTAGTNVIKLLRS